MGEANRIFVTHTRVLYGFVPLELWHLPTHSNASTWWRDRLPGFGLTSRVSLGGHSPLHEAVVTPHCMKRWSRSSPRLRCSLNPTKTPGEPREHTCIVPMHMGFSLVAFFFFSVDVHDPPWQSRHERRVPAKHAYHVDCARLWHSSGYEGQSLVLGGCHLAKQRADFELWGAVSPAIGRRHPPSSD